MKKFLFISIALSISIAAVAQNAPDENLKMQTHESTIKRICEKLFHVAKNDTDRGKYNQELLTEMEAALKETNSFDYPFDSLNTEMAVLPSPDKTFRIINWNVPKDDGTFVYYGFIQEKYVQIIKKGLAKSRSETMQLYPLIDKSTEIKNPENAISDNKKWFGMLYYKIIEKKTKEKTYYTLLAWDGNDKFSTKKIIDVLTFDNNGTPRFGADIFNIQKKFPKRVIFEYSATCNVSLKFSMKKDSIIFDHLAPNSPQLEGQFQYYCSDGSCDGLGFKKGRWNYGADMNAVNDMDEKDKLYHDPHDISPTHNQSNDYKTIMDESAPTGHGNKVVKKDKKKKQK